VNGTRHGSLGARRTEAADPVLQGADWLRGRVHLDTFRICFPLGIVASGLHLAVRALA
jgi:hypothetical protein